MRTTLNIDEDVLETAKELAVEARDDGWPRSVGACAQRLGAARSRCAQT